MGADLKPVAKMSRRALAEELIGYERKLGPTIARIGDLKSALRKFATDEGENFKEEFAGLGQVKVAGAKDGAFKGNMPMLDAEAFNALTKARQDKLVADGLVKIEPQYGGKFYGSVTVELF